MNPDIKRSGAYNKDKKRTGNDALSIYAPARAGIYRFGQCTGFEKDLLAFFKPHKQLEEKIDQTLKDLIDQGLITQESGKKSYRAKSALCRYGLRHPYRS